MRWVSLIGGAALLLVGCHCGDGGEAHRAESDDRAARPSAAVTGVLEGMVRLVDGAELPSYPDNPMVSPPGRPELPEGCTPPQRADAQPVSMTEERGLAGVLVSLHEFETSPSYASVTHELTITDCRLSPRLVVATRGDRLRVTNQTDYPFLPDLGSGVLQAILHQRTREVELGEGGVRSLECAFAAPCGRSYIVTLYHPLHAITDESGRFRIENVPAGEEVRVSAWHPLFQESNEQFVLEMGERRTVDFALEPAPPPPAPDPATPPREGPAENDPSQLF